MTIDEAAAAVRTGQVIGFPTDTVYGLAADPFDTEAVARLFDLKGRPANKPIGLLAAGMGQAMLIGDITGRADDLARRHWPGALTLVVTPKVVLSTWVGDQQQKTVALRVPDLAVARGLLRVTGPLAVTSANRSGGEETLSDRQARAVLGDEVSVYIPGTSPGGMASTVVDATGTEPVILRPGPVII